MNLSTGRKVTGPAAAAVEVLFDGEWPHPDQAAAFDRMLAERIPWRDRIRRWVRSRRRADGRWLPPDYRRPEPRTPGSPRVAP